MRLAGPRFEIGPLSETPSAGVTSTAAAPADNRPACCLPSSDVSSAKTILPPAATAAVPIAAEATKRRRFIVRSVCVIGNCSVEDLDWSTLFNSFHSTKTIARVNYEI